MLRLRSSFKIGNYGYISMTNHALCILEIVIFEETLNYYEILPDLWSTSKKLRKQLIF